VASCCSSQVWFSIIIIDNRLGENLVDESGNQERKCLLLYIYHFFFQILEHFKTFDLVLCFVLVTDKMHFHFHFSGSNEAIWDHCISKEQILDSTVP